MVKGKKGKTTQLIRKHLFQKCGGKGKGKGKGKLGKGKGKGKGKAKAQGKGKEAGAE